MRGEAGDRDGARLLERQIGRHRHDLLLGDSDVFGVRAAAGAEDPVARPEPGDVWSHRFDDPGEVSAQLRVFRPVIVSLPCNKTDAGGDDRRTMAGVSGSDRRLI